MNAIDQLPSGMDPKLAEVLDRMASVFAALSARIARGGIDENLADAAGVNTGGDAQKALDVFADEMFMDALAGSDVRYYASEEQDSVVTLNDTGAFGLAIDPLDGSSNIDTNVSIGTIFGLFPVADDPDSTFLRPGRDLIASGYAIFGPQCAILLTTGDGVLKFVLDPQAGRFVSLGKIGPIASDSVEYAINASNYRHWDTATRAYIDDRVAGSEGPAGTDFNMRWVASLVAETHRILTRGGIFLYPGDARPTYERGRLRYIYECAPIAFLIEQADGLATDGQEAILDNVPDALHARTPFVFGSKNKVARVSTYHDLPPEETSALFGERGLFRV